MVYKNKNLQEISFPLGGIGSGCIGLSGIGQLKDWEIANRPNKNSENEFSHIAVRCFENGEIKDSRVLIGDTNTSYIGKGHGISTATMNGFAHFEENVFIGEYPVAELVFSDRSFPGKVRMRAFNPYIPQNSLDSSIPAAFFEIEFENPGKSQAVYEAAFSVRSLFNSSINECLNDRNGVTMYDAANRDNNMTIAAAGEAISVCDYWYRGWFNSFFKDNIRAFWQDFSSGRPIQTRNYKEAGHEDVCSVCASVTVPPNERRSVRFVLSWSFPERFNYWAPLKDDQGCDVTWKNYYATVWKDSAESALYSLANWDRLYEKTAEFKQALYSSTLSEPMKSAVGSALSVLKSPTVMRLEDGTLYGFEGSGMYDGSCEGTCQHVWNYAYVCCYLFPDLERGLRDVEYKYSLLDSGEICFRTALPLGRAEFANLISSGEKFRPCVDGQMGEIIKTYREWKLSGDTEWLKSQWHNVKKTMDFAWSGDNDQGWDFDCDGIMEGRQHHTLDMELFGPSGWMQGFYLAALRAASQMAETVGDTDSAEKYKELFDSGYNYTKNELFNGKYFIQKIDVEDKSISDKYNCSDMYWNDETKELSCQVSEGCLIDQLVAMWHAELCGIGQIFDAAQARTAALSIYKNNYRHHMRNITNPWRLFSVNDDGGTMICSYPDGVYKPKNPIPYCEETMSGFEYAFAGVLMINGYMEEAEKVVSEVRKRYDGKKGNPWNDVECGNNYVRSMAAFSFIPLMSGFVADLPRKAISFAPRTSLRPFKGLWSTATGWGTVEISADDTCIRVLNGDIILREISLPYAESVCSVSVDGRNVSFTLNGKAIIIDQLTLHSGSIIEVKGKQL